ncbi:hypothetical protein [Aestuariivirga sp.]|uniref:hypothetical protein n=1 Tax=Aestuariivirga sp. TaxID=2650926 RepID=UPI0039E49E21
MFRAKTVLVLGAGASYEVNMPLGSELLERICRLVDIRFDHYQPISGDLCIIDALRAIIDEGRSVDIFNQHIGAARVLLEAAKLALSIDNVIHTLENPKVEMLGKLAIARAILHAEGEANQFRTTERRPEDLDLSQFKGTWYEILAKLITEGLRSSDHQRAFDNLTIVNFNYDRCLEHFLRFHMSGALGIKPELAEQDVVSLSMYRPYGQVGRLPWMPGTVQPAKFGSASTRDILATYGQIRTFTEQVNDDALLESIQHALSVADRIVFLGFGFHRQNIELIKAPIQNHAIVLGTVQGISRNDQEVIKAELCEAFQIDEESGQHRIRLAAETCNDFMKNNWRTLTGAAPERRDTPQFYDPPLEN